MSTNATRPTRSPAGGGRRRWAFIAGAGIVAAIAFAAGAWWLLFGGDAPKAATIDTAAQAAASASPRAIATTTPAGTNRPSAAPGATTSPGATTTPGSGGTTSGTDGTWAIDTSIGSFADGTSTFAGFRVNEVLGQGIGSTTAVGRTPAVTGTLDLSGSTLQSASIEVDLTQIQSDRARRDGAIQRTLETSQFPTATFTLSGPVELGKVPGDGETISVTAPGSLTIHGVSKQVEVKLDVRLVNGTAVVVGQIPFSFAEYGLQAPTAPIVVSVEDSGIVEVQLFFTRAA